MRAAALPRMRPVALEFCYVAPENARAALPPENVDELAANIAEYGLLQPLVGYVDDEGGLAIIGGRRRLAALQQLKAKGSARFDVANIPFAEIAQSDAVGASLAENTQRVDLGIVEAALQFNRMTLDGKSAADIAKVFGVTERFVKGRVRLASLHEPILEALRKGEITLDVAQVYAGAAVARQERVWKSLGKSAGEWRIKQELAKNTLRAGDALAKFVGAGSYLAAGGMIEDELFANPSDSRWLDVALAERLAQEKLKAKAAELEGEGFLFVEPAIELDRSLYVDGNFGKPRKATSEETARLKAIAAREKELSAERKAIHKAADARDPEGFGGDYTPEEDERLDAIEQEEDALRAERRRIDAGKVEFDQKAKERSGVIVTLDSDGALLVRRGVVTPKARKAANGNKAPAGKKNGVSPAGRTAAPKEPAAPMTNLTHEKTSRIASVIVGRALAANPAIALVALTAQAAREIFFYGTHGALTVDGFDRGEEFEGFLSDKEYETASKRWQIALGKDEDALEEKLAKWPQADVLELLAYCVGQAVKVVETNAATDYSDARDRQQLIRLARLAGANPAAHFIPSAEYLEGYSRASLEAALDELGIDSAGLKTKAAIAAAIADKAKGGGATAAWVPPLLRTLCGMPESGVSAAARTAAKKNVAKKRAKKSKTAKVKKVAKKSAKANGAEARP